jgi:SET domain
VPSVCSVIDLLWIHPGQVAKFAHKGRGVMATSPIAKGDYVCEYKGDLVKYTEAKEREAHYEQTGQGSYMFFFSHNSRMWYAAPPQCIVEFLLWFMFLVPVLTQLEKTLL